MTLQTDLENTLTWLNNLEAAIGKIDLLDAMPNNYGGREALRGWLDVLSAEPHAGPYDFDPVTGQVTNAAGDVLATVPHAIAGDAHDLATGYLLAQAPALRALASELARALEDHHKGTNTTRPFAETYERDAALLARARALLEV